MGRLFTTRKKDEGVVISCGGRELHVTVHEITGKYVKLKFEGDEDFFDIQRREMQEQSWRKLN